MIQKVVDFYKDFKEYSRSDQIYGLGFGLLILYVIVSFIAIIFFGKHDISGIAEFFSMPSIYIFTVAVLVEYWKPIKSLFSKKWFKWLIGGIAVLVYKYSEIHANLFINDFVENDPSYFSTASSILTVLYLPYSWLVVISLILSIFVFVHWIFIPQSENDKSPTYGGWTYFARFLGLFWVFLTFTQVKAHFENGESFYSALTKSVILQSEYFEKSHCTNATSNELSAYLDRGYISIYNPRSGKFRTESCNMSAKPENEHNKAIKRN
jgi:hypothetical protein